MEPQEEEQEKKKAVIDLAAEDVDAKLNGNSDKEKKKNKMVVIDLTGEDNDSFKEGSFPSSTPQQDSDSKPPARPPVVMLVSSRSY